VRSDGRNTLAGDGASTVDNLVGCATGDIGSTGFAATEAAAADVAAGGSETTCSVEMGSGAAGFATAGSERAGFAATGSETGRFVATGSDTACFAVAGSETVGFAAAWFETTRSAAPDLATTGIDPDGFATASFGAAAAGPVVAFSRGDVRVAGGSVVASD
jgi:hypothetical protein